MKFKNTESLTNIKPLPKKKNWKLRAYLALGIFLFIFFSFFVYILNEYIQTHTFTPQMPITFHKPIIIKRVEIVSPMASPSAKPKQAMIETPIAYAQEIEPTDTSIIVDKIFALESSRGKNDGCRDQGKFNGYGYAQSTFTWNCFDTQEEVVAKVTNWINTRLAEGYSVPELLCYYNQGIREEKCNYYTNYLSL